MAIVKEKCLDEPQKQNKKDGKIRDTDIREKLKSKELKRFYADGSRVLEEVGILWGDAIADIVVANKYLHGYEIKSEVDSFSRLRKQMYFYSKVFEYCTLVIHEKHLDNFIKSYEMDIPFWGVIAVNKMNGKVVSKKIKKSKKNKNVDIYSVCHFLWRCEVIEIIKEFKIKVKYLANQDKRTLYRILFQSIEKKRLLDVVKNKLITRKAWGSEC